jgi:hypothetical protein
VVCLRVGYPSELPLLIIVDEIYTGASEALDAFYFICIKEKI